MSEPSPPPVSEGPPVDALDDAGERVQPAWAGPPWHVRPAVVAVSAVIGRSSTTAVRLEGARAYPTGVVWRFVVHVREAGRAARRRVLSELDTTHGRGQLDLALPPSGLRWGVALSDGRRATTTDDTVWNDVPDGTDPADWAPTRPLLDGLGRPTSWGGTWSRDVWLWPLPPPGELQVVCAWPDRGIAETSTELDADLLRAAAATARPQWPDGA